MYLGEYRIDDYVTLVATTHRFSYGAAYAPSAITYRVYEDATDVEIVADTAMTNFDTQTGFYLDRIQCTAAIGYETGKTYTALIKATVDSVAAITVYTWRILTPPVNTVQVSGTAQTAGDLVAMITTVDDFIDTEVSAIKTKTDFLPSATAGAAGGLMIAGSNAAVTFATLTVTGATTFTGNVAYSNGITVTQATVNGHGISITGNGTGHGIYSLSGAGSNASGIRCQAQNNGQGLRAIGQGTGAGIICTGGDSSGIGLEANGGTGGHGFTAVGNGAGYDINADVQGNLSGSVNSVTTGVTVTTNNDKTGYSLSSAGIQAIWEYTTRTITAFSTELALSVWAVLESAIATASSIGLKVKTNLDAAVSSRLSSAGYTAPDNASIIAIKAKTDTINWQDVTDSVDEAIGKFSINKTINVLTLYRRDGVTVLKQFNLTDNASVSDRVPV